MENNNQEIDQLCQRIERLERQVSHLVALVERATGMWVFIKWASAAVVSISAFVVFFSDHFKIK